MVFGCIADCCSRLSDGGRDLNVAQSFTCFADPVFALALRNAAADDVNLRQNALNALGAMAYCCDHDTFAKQYSPSMAMMQRCLVFPSESPRQTAAKSSSTTSSPLYAHSRARTWLSSLCLHFS